MPRLLAPLDGSCNGTARGSARHRTWRSLLLALMAGLCTPAAADEIRIGLAAPLTGRAAPEGLAMERALTDAVAAANAAGGILGKRLILRVEDDGCAAATGEGAARTLASQGAAVVIGHPCSNAATAAAPVYAASNVLMIAVGARHSLVTDAHPQAPVLRLAGRDDRQGTAAAAWLRSHAPDGRIAIVHDRTRYGREVADHTVAALAAAGMAPAALIPIVASRRAYDEALAKIDETRAEAVLFAGYPEEAAILADGLGRRAPPPALLGSDSLATAAFAGVAAKARGPVAVLVPVEPQTQGRTDKAPASQAARAQGALEAWLGAARKKGTVDGRALYDALRGAPIETATLGTLRFDAHGDLEAVAFAARVPQGDEWVAEKP